SLMPGSPAIDRGSIDLPSSASRDQRGLSRYSDGNGDGAGNAADLGAFEIQNYVVSALQIRGSSTGGADDGGYGNPFDPSDDAFSISSADVFAQLTAAGRADIGDAVGANNAAGGGSVSFAVTGTSRLKGRELEIRRDLAIYGPGADLLKIDGAKSSPVVRVHEGATAYIKNIALENGYAPVGGGIIVEAESRVDIEGVSLRGNTATGNGGAIAVFSGSAYVFRSSLVGNTAGGRGGAVYSSADLSAFPFKLNIDNSTLANNKASLSGGAVYSAQSLLIDSSALVNNTTNGSISGVFLDSNSEGLGRIVNSLLARNGDESLQALVPAALLSEGHNIADGDESLLSEDSDLINTDPKIGQLAYNQEGTQFHALLPDSQAINSGATIPPPPAFDQPGLARIRGTNAQGAPAIDVGPVEYPHDNPIIDGDNDHAIIDCPSQITQTCVGPDGATITVRFFVANP
ncbi:MAG TPA: choice-of-anchor Q domain-containing protein, partial [Sphingomonadaceae bacterium]|nr:choice-of-anchor Q domain-containing protein [Sphingomonadaceae bacterium]